LVRDIPKVLYKYLKKEFAKKLIEEGVIRIGTLHEYRKYEDTDRERKDQLEGTTSSFTEVTEPVIATNQDEVPGAYSGFIKVEKGGTLKILSGSADIIKVHVDVYMYCLTQAFSYKQMKDFQCDSCVRIDNPKAFIDTITDCINEYTTGDVFGGKCCYSSRRQEYGQSECVTPPYLIKDPSYSKQKEFRLVWFSNKSNLKTPIRPFLLNTGSSDRVNKDNFWHPALINSNFALSPFLTTCTALTEYCSFATRDG